MTVAARTLLVAGQVHRYLVAEPPGPATGIILSLHGRLSAPANQVRLTRMDGLATNGAVVGFPEGSIRSGRGFDWDHDADVAFLAALVAELHDRYPTPTARACVSGMSAGRGWPATSRMPAATW